MSDNETKRRSAYTVIQSDEHAVFLVDNDGALSVTNDAERVCAEVRRAYTSKHIVYRDTLNQWEEMIMGPGGKVDFSPWHGCIPVLPVTKSFKAAVQEVYRNSLTGKLDKLREEESRWKRKLTIATNKLADARAAIDKFIDAQVEGK